MLRMPVVRLVLGLAIVAGAAALSAAPARATVSLSISPAVIRVEGEAGAGDGRPISAVNLGDEPIDLVVTVHELDGLTGERSAASWLTVEPSSLHLEPGQQGEVNVAIAIPGELPSGGR